MTYITPKFKTTDNTNSKFIVLCPAGEGSKNGRVSKSYKTLPSFRMHLDQCGSFDKCTKRCPKKSEVISAILRTQKKYGKDARVELVPEFSEWGILVR